MDTLTPKERSKRMSLVRSKHTQPELLVRRIVHGMGYRYRLHDSKLPGSPDIVLKRLQKAIFIHGCFWHGHPCHSGRARVPKSRVDFWLGKISSNKNRDAAVRRAIRKMGWSVLVLWECGLKDQEKLEKTIRRFLDA
ncbi:MAG: very short patch repair endonuclease [Alphaproteobacteria bacterium]